LAAKPTTSPATPAEDFTWYEVSKDVNRVGNSGPHLIAPVEPEPGTHSDMLDEDQDEDAKPR
jgi:hypothetical protein